MSILYCSVIAKNEKILLAESTVTESFNNRLKSLYNQIIKKNICDTIEIENGQLVTFLKTKKIIFTCISPVKYGEDRPRRFIEQFAAMIIKDSGGVEMIIPNEKISKLCLQSKFDEKLNKLIQDFDTGMYGSKELINEMQNDMNDIKQEMGKNIKKMVANQTELDEMLLVSQKIKTKAKDYKEDAKTLERETRCCKPWMIIFSIIILVSFIVYSIFVLYLCGSLSVTCEKKNAPPRL
jgi:hypothetical protein